MRTLMLAGASALALVAAPVLAQEATDTTDPATTLPDTTTATDTTTGTDTTTTMAAGDVEQNAILSAENVGIRDARGMQDVVVLQGTMDTGTQVYLIVGPGGELLALASPLSSMPGSPGTQSGVAIEGSGDQAGLGTDPGMWDATQIENVMRRFQDTGTGTGLDTGTETGTEEQSN